MIASKYQVLKDDDLRKINANLEAQFMADIQVSNFPQCMKGGSHSECNINSVNIKVDDTNSVYLNPCCEMCLLEQSNGQYQNINLKEFLAQAYREANSQCSQNPFMECIEPTLSLLENSLTRLLDSKDRLAIYCEQLTEKIEQLRQKIELYPPLQVRNTLEQIKECTKVQNQDEQHSIIISQLFQLSQLINLNEKNQSTIKGGCLDIGLYYLLGQKAKSDASIINQCLDKSFFVINDLDQSESVQSYGKRVLNSFNQMKQDGILQTQSFYEYVRRMKQIGLQKEELFVDNNIDFSVLYLYEKHKFQGQQQYQPQINQFHNAQQLNFNQTQTLNKNSCLAIHAHKNHNGEKNKIEREFDLSSSQKKRPKIFVDDNNLKQFPNKH